MKRPRRILLLTPYTGGNLGDGAIQDAVIHHLRRRLGDPVLQLITLAPAATSRLHRVPSFPIGGARGRMRRLRDALHWVQAFGIVRRSDLLVISGGGQIDDYWGGPSDQPYALFKWTLLAKAAGIPVAFLSVGVSVLAQGRSLRLSAGALRRATYRSFRDNDSKELLRTLRFTDGDPVIADLAFSHPAVSAAPEADPSPAGRPRTVGVSAMAYFRERVWPEQDPEVHGRYLARLAGFVDRLLDAGWTVVLFTTAAMDHSTLDDLRSKLRPDGRAAGRLRCVKPACADALLAEIRTWDLVVASRLHGVILPHLLSRPVLALSYDRKVRAHMRAIGQEEFCLELKSAEPEAVWERFTALAGCAAAATLALRARTSEYARRLERQYDDLAGIVAPRSGS